jgi:hypothetical protein
MLLLLGKLLLINKSEKDLPSDRTLAYTSYSGSQLPVTNHRRAAMEDREQAALDMIMRHGSCDYDSRDSTQYLLDQLVRLFTGDGYDEWVAYLRDGDDGPRTHYWDEGVAP